MNIDFKHFINEVYTDVKTKWTDIQQLTEIKTQEQDFLRPFITRTKYNKNKMFYVRCL